VSCWGPRASSSSRVTISAPSQVSPIKVKKRHRTASLQASASLPFPLPCLRHEQMQRTTLLVAARVDRITSSPVPLPGRSVCERRGSDGHGAWARACPVQHHPFLILISAASHGGSPTSTSPPFSSTLPPEVRIRSSSLICFSIWTCLDFRVFYQVQLGRTQLTHSTLTPHAHKRVRIRTHAKKRLGGVAFSPWKTRSSTELSYLLF